MKTINFTVAIALAQCSLLCATIVATECGIFSDHADIGIVKHAGNAKYDSATKSYTVSSSGENLWHTQDAFHYVWKKVSGDIALAADIEFLGTSSQPHRKACLMIRQSLDADSAYADAVVHGDGLTSFQFREVKGGVTREVQSSVKAPRRLRIEKIKDTCYMSLAAGGEDVAPSGCSTPIPFTGEFYIGMGVCAHNADAVETAVFSHVAITPPFTAVAEVRSSLEYVVASSGDRRSVYHTTELIEAPNWSRDDESLYFNSNGRIYRFGLSSTAKPEAIDTGFATKCNNDHGISPDGTLLAISHRASDKRSHIYVLPASGGTPREVTPHGPSYWHGWSPDGTTLAFCASREGKFGIFTIPVTGGEETRLTTTEGLDDGPDYSPDGKWIYFNSDRTGRMQIWRMRPNGSEQQQMTNDDLNNWFPHPSPDGKWIVFLTYAGNVKGHPADKDVMLRLMPADGGKIRNLAQFFGGQGTINVPSWSPDSTKIAYVRYQPKIEKASISR